MPSTAIPQALLELDHHWYDEVLGCEAAVIEATLEPLAITGATGELARVRLTYDDAGTPGPGSVIAKLRGTSPTQQAMDGALDLFDRERHFYVDVAAGLPLTTPACWFAGDGDRLPLLLEDLHLLRMGDQVAGLTLDEADGLLDVLADLHAAFWDQPAPGGPGWTVSLRDPLFAGMLTQLITSGVLALKERYAGRVSARILDAIAEAAPNWGDVLARCDEGPRTLVHNDCRLDNLFFHAGGEPVFIDWQLCGHTRGTQDVAYLLSGSVGALLLHTRWEQLLRRYHERLVVNGVVGYSWNQCLLHYRQSLLYTLAPGVAMLGAMAIAGDDRGLADTLILRTLTHAAELDAFGTL